MLDYASNEPRGRTNGKYSLNTFEWIIGLLLGAVVLSALARRTKVPYPTFLAVGGMCWRSCRSPSWTLEPDLALALFVAPVLLDAAFDTSLRELRDNWLPVSTLVFVAVGAHHRGGRGAGALAGAGHAMGRSDRARRHRRAARMPPRRPRSSARSTCPIAC